MAWKSGVTLEGRISPVPSKGQNEEINTYLAFIMPWLVLNRLRGKLKESHDSPKT